MSVWGITRLSAVRRFECVAGPPLRAMVFWRLDGPLGGPRGPWGRFDSFFFSYIFFFGGGRGGISLRVICGLCESAFALSRSYALLAALPPFIRLCSFAAMHYYGLWTLIQTLHGCCAPLGVHGHFGPGLRPTPVLFILSTLF